MAVHCNDGSTTKIYIILLLKLHVTSSAECSYQISREDYGFSDLILKDKMSLPRRTDSHILVVQMMLPVMYDNFMPSVLNSPCG